MKKLNILFFILFTACSTVQQINTENTEVLKSSQILEVFADYQTYMWDKDSLSWHQPLNLTISTDTKPLLSVLYTIGEIKRRNDPAYLDSLTLNFKFKKIHLEHDTQQKFVTFQVSEEAPNGKLFLKTTGRLTIDGVDFQIFSIDNPTINSQLVYVKYFNTWQKDYQIRRFLLRTDGGK